MSRKTVDFDSPRAIYSIRRANSSSPRVLHPWDALKSAFVQRFLSVMTYEFIANKSMAKSYLPTTFLPQASKQVKTIPCDLAAPPAEELADKSNAPFRIVLFVN